MSAQQQQQLEQEIAALERELAELTASLPKHSIKASQMIRIEELEDQIAQKQDALAPSKHEPQISQICQTYKE